MHALIDNDSHLQYHAKNCWGHQVTLKAQAHNSYRTTVLMAVAALHFVFLGLLLKPNLIQITSAPHPVLVALINSERPLHQNQVPHPLITANQEQATEAPEALIDTVSIPVVITPEQNGDRATADTITATEISPPVTTPAQSILVRETELSYLRIPDIRRPISSKRAGEHGVVYLMLFINETGVVTQVQIERSSQFERLDNAAIRAMRTAIFQPVMRNGVPISVKAIVPVEFPP